MNSLKFRLAALAAAGYTHLARTPRTKDGLRVLMYHDLSHSDSSDLYTLRAETFITQLNRLIEWADENDASFHFVADEPKPGIAVTFDDGYMSTLQIAAPILAEHRIPFHVYVSRVFVAGADRRFLCESSLKDLAAVPGARIGAHGLSHRPLATLSIDDQATELRGSREWLEDVLQIRVHEMSFPHGSHSDDVVRTASSAGYDIACCSAVGTYVDSSQKMSVPRIDVWSHDDEATVVNKVRGGWDWLMP